MKCWRKVWTTEGTGVHGGNPELIRGFLDLMVVTLAHPFVLNRWPGTSIAPISPMGPAQKEALPVRIFLMLSASFHPTRRLVTGAGRAGFRAQRRKARPCSWLAFGTMRATV